MLCMNMRICFVFGRTMKSATVVVYLVLIRDLLTVECACIFCALCGVDFILGFKKVVIFGP